MTAVVPILGAEGDGFWATAYPIIPHPGEIVVGLICFGIIVFLAFKYAVPRLEAVIAARRTEIEGGIAKAEQAQAEADAALVEYREQLTSARAEAGRLREEAREEGAVILAEMRERAQAESARITEAAQRQVASERAQAITQLRQQVGGLASTLAAKIVGESLQDDARQSRVIDRFLDELEADEVTRSGASDDQRATAGVGASSSTPGSGSEGTSGVTGLLGKVVDKVLGNDEERR